MSKRGLTGKLVSVKWDDASGTSAWRDLDSYDLESYEVETVGFVVKENKRHIGIASTVCRSHKRVSDCTTIPKKMILKVKVLKGRL